MLSKKQFLIFSPPFDPLSGGVCALHQLCHVLNILGGNAFIVPFFENPNYYPKSKLTNYILIHFKNLQRKFIKFHTNPAWETPILKNPDRRLLESGHYIVIYPEIVVGNPLDAAHVVRWLLYDYGFHVPSTSFCSGDIIVRYHNGFHCPEFEGCVYLEEGLTAEQPPFTTYLAAGELSKREGRRGIALAIKKGRDFFDPELFPGAKVIDGKSHDETAEIFSLSEIFVSFDQDTMLSRFAVLAGCESVVVPRPNQTKEEWLRGDNQMGVAFGFDDLAVAATTRHLVKPWFENSEQRTRSSVERFLNNLEKVLCEIPAEGKHY